MKACPYCAEEIQDAAIKCKHCGEFFAALEVPKSPPDPSKNAEATRENPKLTSPVQYPSGCYAAAAAVLFVILVLSGHSIYQAINASPKYEPDLLQQKYDYAAKRAEENRKVRQGY